MSGTTQHPNYISAEQGMNGKSEVQHQELGRQISMNLTNEQYERLFLQTGGQGATKGNLSQMVGNPTPLGILSFLLCLTPFSCELMGFAGTTTNAAAVSIGSYYFIGGLGLYLAGIMEWIIGNTFPATVFCSFGAFWLAFAFLLQPTQGIAEALSASPRDYNAGLALYLVWWGLLTFIYLIASFRTNLVFVGLFFFLDLGFWLLVASYFNISKGEVGNLPSLLKAAGAMYFLCCMCGWYLLLVLVAGSTGIPIKLPIGDMSGFMSGKKDKRT